MNPRHCTRIFVRGLAPRLQEGNPFSFKHVRVVKGAGQFDSDGPCVVMATPSMLQSGLSRDLFEAWCEDDRNAIIICDFAVQVCVHAQAPGIYHARALVAAEPPSIPPVTRCLVPCRQTPPTYPPRARWRATSSATPRPC